MICPGCKKEQADFAICDNDCGTYICMECDSSFYFIIQHNKQIIIIGHSPYCGEY
jgi:hypothetical protein